MLPATVEPSRAVYYGMPAILKPSGKNKRSTKNKKRRRLRWSSPLVTSINGERAVAHRTQRTAATIILRIARNQTIDIPEKTWYRYAILKNENASPTLYAINTPQMRRLLAQKNIVVKRLDGLEANAPFGYGSTVSGDQVKRLVSSHRRNLAKATRGRSTPSR